MHWMRNSTIRFPWKCWATTTLVTYFLQEIWLLRNWTAQADRPQVIAVTVLFAVPFLGVAAAFSFIVCSIFGLMSKRLPMPTVNRQLPETPTRRPERLLISAILSSVAASTICLRWQDVLVTYVHGFLPIPILWMFLFIALGTVFLLVLSVRDRRRGRMIKPDGLSHS